MSPEHLRRLLHALRRTDAAFDLPPVREAAALIEAQHALLREALPHLPPELRFRVEQAAPEL